MKINITCGQIINDILKNKSNEIFIPFNESMIQGNPTFPIFDEHFIQERTQTHTTTLKNYSKVMNDFLEFKNHLHNYDEIILWFGSDMFCQINVLTLLGYFNQENYSYDITLHIIDENNLNIKKTIKISQKNYHIIYQQVLLHHQKINNLYEEMDQAISDYLNLKNKQHPIYQYIQDHLGEPDLIQKILIEFSSYGLGDTQIKEMIQEVKQTF